MNNFVLHGTQQRFVEKIQDNGLINKNSSVFIVDSNDKGNLEFTIKMALYHAIGIETQDKIINGGYYKISDFYIENQELLPVLIIFNKKVNSIVNNQRYKFIENEKILTFPYEKIFNIGNITKEKIIKIIFISIEDIIVAENHINNKLSSGIDRFFVKNNESIDCNYIKDKKLINYNLIDKNYLINFLTNFLYIKFNLLRSSHSKLTT